MKCDVCGGDVVNGKCTYCGKVFDDTDEKSVKKNTLKNKHAKRKNSKSGLWIYLIIIAVLFFIVLISSSDSSNTNSVWAAEDTDIDDFEYDLYPAARIIHINRYKGNDKKIRIAPTYEIDGATYRVRELDGTFGSHNIQIDSVIIPEGVTDVSASTFRKSQVKYVYLPSTLKTVSDGILSNFTDVKKLYYGGSEQMWNRLSGDSDTSGIEEIIFNANPSLESPDESLTEDELLATSEIWVEVEYDPLKDFSYRISGDEIILNSYNGNDNIVEITPSYTIDGNEYKTNLSKFNAKSDVRTWIFDDGITEINRACFNGVYPRNIFFPSTMDNIYDNMLTQLNTGVSVVNIYFAGSEDDWSSILTHYESSDPFDEDRAYELGQEYASKLRDFLNGESNDSDHIIYHFNASPDDLK